MTSPIRLALFNNLAFLLQMQGDLGSAQTAVRTGADNPRDRPSLKNHPETATSLAGLASLLQARGDLAGARPLHERTLAIFEKDLVPSIPTSPEG